MKQYKDHIPLSDSQMGIYLECAQNENALQYNINFEYTLDRAVDADRLAEACNRVLAHYAAFSAVVEVVDGAPALIRYDGITPKAQRFTLTEEEYREHRRCFIRPFRFDGSPLCRIEIIDTPQAIYLLTDIHHLIYDGTSTQLFEQALDRAYRGEPLPPEEHTIFDAGRAEREHEQSAELKASYDYFEQKLGGVETDSNLLPDRSDADTDRCAMHIADLTVTIAEMKAFAQRLGVTENVVLLAAFAYALAKHSGQTEALFASVDSGRRGKPLQNTMGFFVRTFPLYFTIDEHCLVEDYVRRVKSEYFETMGHDDASFAELAHRFGIRSDVKYVFNGDILNDPLFDGRPMKKYLFDYDAAMSNLDVMLCRAGERYQLRLDYRTALYSEENIKAFASLYDRIVEGLLRAERLSDIDLLTASDRSFIDRFNQTDTPYDRSQTVWDLLLQHTASDGGKAAVHFKETTLSYAQLDALTARLAAYLHGRGIGTDDFVPVLIPRNEFMPIAAWGVVRAGAAYQPLDPSYPQERLNFMVKDSGARMLIADRALRPLLDQYEGEVLYTDEIAALPAADGFRPLDHPADALVIIYTSGTTGTPKGCVLENRNIVCFHHNHAAVMGLGPDAQVATYASFGFDAGIMDIFTTLMAGGTLHVVPDEIRLDIFGINEFYKSNAITHGFITTQVGRMFAEITDCDSLRALLVGGEKLVPFLPPAGFEFINGYGPSETIAYVCHHRVTDGSVLQPIGIPSGNTRLYVADSFGRLLPPGACGELCIAGDQVGRGYLNRPDKTAEVFVANPFADEEHYRRMYRTGDIVRLLPSGEIDFVGRRDGQVKIRGFRIELTEVEQVIREFDGIRNATVQAFDNPGGGKYIAAYVVGDGEISTEALNQFIRSRKPDYMVPEVTMQLEQIPLNANGKVDRRKLPAPQRQQKSLTPPQNEVQQRIFDKVAEVVGHAEFGIDTDLFATGLTSIGVIRLTVLLAEAFGVSLRIKDIKSNNTIALLEPLLQSGPAARRREQCDDYPLAKTQEGIYIEWLTQPEATTYNIPLLLKIDSRLDTQRLKDAIVQAVAAHPYMDVRLFTADDGSIRQRPNGEAPFCAEDIEELTADTLEAVRGSLLKPYDLMGHRLFRMTLIHADGCYLYLDVHHIIGDGTSLNLLVDDIAAAYQGRAVATETFSGFDVAMDEHAGRTEAELALEQQHYDKYFGDGDSDFLPPADRHPEAPRGSGLMEWRSAQGRAEAAEQFCQAHGISMNGLMLSVFGLVLAKYNASDHSVFTTIYNGRNDSRTSRTFAMLVKTLPVQVRLADEAPARLAREVSDQVLESMANDRYSFAEISRQYGISSNVMFIYQGADFGFSTFCGMPAAIVPVEMADKKSPIAIQVSLADGRFVYQTDYDNERYSEAMIQSVIRAFDHALGSFVDSQKLSEVTLTDDEMRSQMDRYNETAMDFDESKTMVSWLEETIGQQADRCAVWCEGREYSYARLDDLTARVAAWLQQQGIGKGQFVPVLVDRNEYMAIGAWGVLRAGAAYEPLDPAYPPERLQFMLEDAGARVAIADRNLAHLLRGSDMRVLYTDEIGSLPEAPGFRCDISPDDPYIIIYTSGTTGKPKGNMLAHRNPVSLFSHHLPHAGLTPESRTAYYTGFSFDAGMLDLHASLLSGGTLYIVPEDIRRDPGALDHFFCQHGITHSCMTTQMGSLFMSMTRCSTLQYFMVGGEKLVPFTPPQGIRFVNGYGPCECTVYTSRYEVQDGTSHQPIGKPTPNTQFYIADSHLNRLPIGAAGELCIASKQVGLGYLNRPDKTAEAFVDNPFSAEPAYRQMYRTGDIVRELPDGNYDFVGRRDGQVKIRGYRVELTEVEQAVRSYKGIKNATVQAFDEAGGGKYIAAFIVSDTAIDVDDLAQFIAQSKPAYMVPAAIMQLDQIPLTANGKVDKRALPQPERTRSRKGAEPANEAERTFCDIFAQVLGLEKVYADDDFFSIGGSSISAAQVVVKCDDAGYNIVFKNLFENSTPKQLAAYAAGGKSEDICAPSGAEKEKNDYSCLQYNIADNLPRISYQGVGDVLLTGVTGFLGAHVYRALIDHTDGQVICVVRSKAGLPAEARFRMMMVYYFEDWYTEACEQRTVVVDAELTDLNLGEKLEHLHFDTIINTAANVKHFDLLDHLRRDNYETVERLIDVAERHDARLVQCSSLSVAGESVNGSIPIDYRFRETDLNIGQSLENKYIYTKYLAEQAVVDAVSRGRIRGKIVRLGNLAARDSDGEFQVNPSNSGLFKFIQGYIKLGCYPVDSMDVPIEFSPIDRTAEALVLLSGTPDEFTVFQAKNCHVIHYGHLIYALRKRGFHIDIVETEEFQARYRKALAEESDISAFTGFIAYLNRKDESVTDALSYSDNGDLAQAPQYDTRIKIASDPAFTTKALYRLGFAWPITGREYLENLIQCLDEKAFF